MGRIFANVTVTNVQDPSKSLSFRAMVDTGASHLTLPSAWREQLGEFETDDPAQMETATQDFVDVSLCGPVRVQVEQFRPTYSEVVFVDMTPHEGEYEPLLGYLVLEQSGLAVDMLGHGLIKLKAFDLK